MDEDDQEWYTNRERWVEEDARATIVALHVARLAGQQAQRSGAVMDRNDPRA